ncbi:MFS transporter [Paludibacterium paludis]|uniref:MFS transporter n=1 Tax=Paludibacterium paludis TaxID=1225769 RepID=A0A918P109_9NEIS|nr:MFS transporter [Paludibacterium paludis]GGY11126.1 MFS transporter [Paludibacterium paludis]
MSDLSESSYSTASRFTHALPWLVAMAFFMQALDTTILNTALPAMAIDLHRSALDMEGTVISYAMTVALLIPVSGWLADRYGTRRIFMASVGVFTAGSLFCALSTHLPMLVLARIVQGSGGAIMTPVARLALMRSYSRTEYVKVLSLVTLPALLGPVLGPLLGGWLVSVASWHWVFLINLPVGIAGILLARSIMPDFRSEGSPFDVAGFILFGSGLVAVSLALETVGGGGVPLTAVAVLGLGGLALLVAYVRHARRASAPLFSLALFRSRAYNAGVLGNLVTRLGNGGIALLLPLMMQVGFGDDARTAGVLMMPVALAAMLATPHLPTLVGRLGFRRTLVGFTLVTSVATAGLGLISATTPMWITLPLLMAFGAASAVVLVAGNTLALGDVPPELASQGNSLVTVSQQLSISLGVACASSVLNLFRPDNAQGLALVPSFHATFVVLGIMTLVSSLVFARLRPGDGRHLQGSAPAVHMD